MDKTLFNPSGYMDKTSHDAINNVEKEAKRKIDKGNREDAAEVLIKTLKEVIWLSGFKLADRIKLEDPKTGKKYL
ncbi:MAG: hypothetical protein PHR92_16130 [Lachnospiraceae bacterium]|nr:hypothetical protein [Lachnospiraceae bacterium]